LLSHVACAILARSTNEGKVRPLFIEERLWKPREDVTEARRGGQRNFWVTTDAPDGTHLRQTAGINPIRKARSGRRPGVAIFLTPAGERHRLPWLDEVDTENGFIRYFGDNKPELSSPAERAPGNKVLLEEMDVATSDTLADRCRAAPLLFFRNHSNPVGEPMTEFLGFGVIKEAHRVTQLFRGNTFSNYAFDCVLFEGDSYQDDRQFLDIGWIDARRDPSLDDAACLAMAPASWRLWARTGNETLNSREVRRFVIPHSWPYEEQVPTKQSSLGSVLQRIYERYDGDYRHGFQALAALVAAHVISEPGLTYQEGWITPIGPDGGVDFVQRLDLGSGFSSASLIVLGQAKCKKPWPKGNGVSAEELARVVARLQRGWVGVYVTTSFFTEPAQREMAMDKYPILLIPGKRLAESSEQLRSGLGIGTPNEFLDWVDGEYVRMVNNARPRASEMARELRGLEGERRNDQGKIDEPGGYATSR
jgi:AspBHI-like restriction endonuclease/restriction endonuclease